MEHYELSYTIRHFHIKEFNDFASSTNVKGPHITSKIYHTVNYDLS